MGFLDTFKGKQYKSELLELQSEMERLKSVMTPEMQDAFNLKNEIHVLHQQRDETEQHISSLNQVISSKNNEINSLNQTIEQKKKQIVWMDDEILVQEFGLYKPQFDFASSLDYKEALAEVRRVEKQLIKDKQAVTGNNNWTVNGNVAQGRKMVNDTQKLLLRAFNNECDDLINKVIYTNFDASLNKIYKSAEAISKLDTIIQLSITQEYLSCKVKELRLAFEYQQRKQQEKEEQKAARAEQREQAKVQKELDEQRKRIEKEQAHYQKALDNLKLQLDLRPDDPDLLKKSMELQNQLLDIDKALSDIDYRQANMKAGYVYIISNIGAFGENVYKIGMTRRLEPQDRVDELGDASVPFKFDVHAMIFSDDAPALEASLHRAFADRKLNMVNQRREFFNVTLDEIKQVVKQNYDKTVEFVDVPEAEQYRVSLKMRENSTFQ